jgi:hypothetical protein
MVWYTWQTHEDDDRPFYCSQLDKNIRIQLMHLILKYFSLFSVSYMLHLLVTHIFSGPSRLKTLFTFGPEELCNGRNMKCKVNKVGRSLLFYGIKCVKTVSNL